jgi:uncharacterized protein
MMNKVKCHQSGKKAILFVLIFCVTGFTSCTNKSATISQTEKADKTTNQTGNNMKNLISIVEIPVMDFSKAVTFYQAILNVVIEEVDMGEVHMGVLPSNGETVNVALVKGAEYKPTTSGTIIYLNAGDDLQPMLDKVKQNGGKIIIPKTEISPEMGFFALFTDTEGNKLGLHSAK